MCDKKSRTKLSLEDKMALFAYKEEHPDASFATITEIFTEKLNKKIDRTNIRLDDQEAVTEPVREPEDEVVLELVDPGESGVIVATPSVNQVTSTRKRKQPAITDFFAKKNQLKLNLCSPTDFYWQLPLNRGKICIILVDTPYKQQYSL